MTTFEIYDGKMNSFAGKIEKLNRRARRLGQPEIVVIYGESFLREVVVNALTGEKMNARFTNVQVEGKSPMVEGWSFVAVIEHDEAGNIIRRLPSFEGTIEPRYREAAPVCDHCQKARVRNSTYIIADGEGVQKQVGSNCLKDFTGHSSPEAVASWAEVLSDLEALFAEDEEFDGFGKSSPYIPMKEFLARVHAVISRDGYMSRTKGRELMKVATADKVIDSFYARRPEDKIETTEDDQNAAEQVIDWAATYFEAEAEKKDDDYVWNMKVIMNGDFLNERHAGFAASVFGAFARAEERRITREAASKSGKFIGAEGDKVEFTGVVSFKKYLGDNGFGGYTTIIKFETTEGDAVVWFASKHEDDLPAVGEQVKVKGTVKKAEVSNFSGRPETTITRAKITG